MQPIIDDSRLMPILEKVQAGERLTFDDGVDALPHARHAGSATWRISCASGCTANVTYFNVNRHINPTDVCVASCRLCAFGKRVRDPKAYTMSLDEVWTRAGRGLVGSDHRVSHRRRPASGAVRSTGIARCCAA